MNFIKMTITGGFFIVLPALLAYLLFVESLALIHVISEPIHDFLFGSESEIFKGFLLLDILLLVLVSFFVGLMACSETGKRVGGWIEHKLLSSMPLYNVLKQFSRAFSGNQQQYLKPALLKQPTGTQAIVFIVEENENGQCTVFLPNSPTPTLGSVQIADRSLLTPIDAPFNKIMNSLWQYGHGTQALLQHASGKTSEHE